MYEYALSFKLHGDGNPLLIEYKDSISHFCYVVMMSDIANEKHFRGILARGHLFDFETPYGYGGPLTSNPISVESQFCFLDEITAFAKTNNVISQFIRFHPLLMNHEVATCVFETKYLHDTIYIDTESPEIIMANMDSKNRNMVRKAINYGITIRQMSVEEYRDFIPIYEETMVKNKATDYYFFDEEYFKAQLALKENSCIFYAMMDNKPISAAIMYYNDRFLHYHLAGTHSDYRKYAPNNLLLYEAACWACGRGIKKFHLGGGLSEDDSLFGFKKQFNKNGRLPFVIGRTIFDKDKYQELMRIRKATDPEFDNNNTRMIQYR